MLNIRKEYSPKIYNSANCRTHTDHVENNLYNKSDSRTFNNTNNTYKDINQNTTEVVNTYKINKHSKLKKTYHNINDNVVIPEKEIQYTLMIIAMLLNTINLLMLQITVIIQSIEHTSNMTNNTTKHNHNNYEHNVFKHANCHIAHINSYATEISHYREKANKHMKHINKSTMVLLILDKSKTFHYRDKQVS